jgi:RNA polymerase sigma-70 factor (ECF subfamily)
MAPEPGTDIDLVRATLSGEAEAYRALVERHERRTYRFLLKHVAQADDAEDLAQETFLQAYRSLTGFRGEGQFTTWLIGIALNVARNHHNRSRAPAGAGDADELESLLADTGDPVETAQRLAHLRAVQLAISELPPEQRECVTVIALEGLGYEDASRILGVPVGTIKSRLARARAKLAEAVKDH